MSAAHTPGPWRLSEPKKDWNGDYTLFEVHWSDAGECIAEFVHGEADARLVSAAPDMLGALIAVRARFQSYNHGPDEQMVMDRVNAAIAKALGRTPNSKDDEA